MSDATVFIGIDPTAGARGITCAVLDDGLRIDWLGQGTFEEIVRAVLVRPAALCAIDAPCGLNHGLMADPAYRERLGLYPQRANYSTYRVSEFELRRRRIHIYNTPANEDQLAGWMQEGYRLYNALRGAGYVDHPRPGERRLFETYPHAIYTVLAGSRPYRKTSVQGLLQRQLLLFEEGVGVPDPMMALEEWTRHHLMRGQLNMADIYSHDELDALAAAYTAYVLAREPHNTTAVGDPAEGQIILPTGALKERY